LTSGLAASSSRVSSALPSSSATIASQTRAAEARYSGMSSAASRTGSRQTTPLPPLHVRFVRETPASVRRPCASSRRPFVRAAPQPRIGRCRGSRAPRGKRKGLDRLSTALVQRLARGALVPSLRPSWPKCDLQRYGWVPPPTHDPLGSVPTGRPCRSYRRTPPRRRLATPRGERATPRLMARVARLHWLERGCLAEGQG
jgi:hypothetical protein